MKRRHQKAQTVVSLMRIPDLAGIQMNGGVRLGATTILVRSGHGADAEPGAGDLADHITDDLAGAVAIIAGLVGKE